MKRKPLISDRRGDQKRLAQRAWDKTPGPTDEKDFPYEVQRRFPVRKVLISLGSKGSVCFEGNNAINAEAGKVKVIDTVGAGDSLSAAFLYFLSMGDDTAAALSKASALADYVVTKRGAIPDYDEDIRRRLNA